MYVGLYVCMDVILDGWMDGFILRRGGGESERKRPTRTYQFFSSCSQKHVIIFLGYLTIIVAKDSQKRNMEST